MVTYNDLVQTLKAMEHTLEASNRVSNAYDFKIALALCATTIIIIVIVCITICFVTNRKEKKTVKTILDDILTNDQDTIKKIKDKVCQNNTKDNVNNN